MAAQLKNSPILHLDIHAGIGIVPVISVIPGLAGACQISGRMLRVRAYQHNLAGINGKPAGGIAEICMNAVQRPGTGAGIMYLQGSISSIAERAEEGATGREGHIGGGARLIVGNDGILRERLQAEIPLGAFSPAVSVEIQRAAAVAKSEISLNLGDSALQHHRGAIVGKHIVGGVALLLVQIDLASATQVQHDIVIPRSLQVQITRPDFPELTGLIIADQLEEHIYPFANDITGGIEIAIALDGIRCRSLVPPGELSVANAQIKVSGKNHLVAGIIRCLEHQVIRHEQIGIVQAAFRSVILTGIQVILRPGVPVIQVSDGCHVIPGVQAILNPGIAGQHIPLGISRLTLPERG